MKRISSFFTSLLRYFQKINFTTIFRKIKLSENVCKGNLYGRIHYYWEIHSFYKSSTISRPIFKKSILPQFSRNRSFRKFWTKETCINRIRILFFEETRWKLLIMNQSTRCFLCLEYYTRSDFSRAFGIPWLVHGVALSVAIPVSKVARLATLPQ